MPKNNQNPKDFNDVDGLSITENDDGTFQIEWDENDPRYSIFKGCLLYTSDAADE